jgi:hypothetical protein
VTYSVVVSTTRGMRRRITSVLLLSLFLSILLLSYSLLGHSVGNRFALRRSLRCGSAAISTLIVLASITLGTYSYSISSDRAFLTLLICLRLASGLSPLCY